MHFDGIKKGLNVLFDTFDGKGQTEHHYYLLHETNAY